MLLNNVILHIDMKNLSLIKIATRITCKHDYLSMILDIMENVMTHDDEIIFNDKISDNCALAIMNNDRAYVKFDKNKIVSISFPFGYSKEGSIFRYENGIIEMKTLSHLRTLLQEVTSNGFSSETLEICNEGIDPDSDEYITDSDMKLFTKLLLIEPSYIRYDHDKRNCNKYLHPLNHFNVNYTESSSYMLGLKKRITLNDFIKIIKGSEGVVQLKYPSKINYRLCKNRLKIFLRRLVSISKWVTHTTK